METSRPASNPRTPAQPAPPDARTQARKRATLGESVKERAAQRVKQAKEEPKKRKEFILGPNKTGSGMLVAALVVGAFGSGDVPSDLARHASICVIIGLALSALMDVRKGLRNLVRTDLMAMFALYFLTFLEFLFPQPVFDEQVSMRAARWGTQCVLIGFAGMIAGRHLVRPKAVGMKSVQNISLSPNVFFFMLAGAFVIAHLAEFLAISFNPFEWIHQLMRPRFSQPWGRGKFGNLSTLINQFDLIGYVVPPLCGILWAKLKRVNKVLLVLATIITALQFFAAFAGGTRNVLAANMAGFIAGFLLNRPKLKIKEIGIMGASCAVIFFFAAGHMLAFRNMGLERYIDLGLYKTTGGMKTVESEDDTKEKSYYVDLNLMNVALLTDVFPKPNPYLGWNLPFVAATKPVPRAFWPNKPVDLDVGIEQALGVSGLTLSATFVGEAYMTGGAVMVFIFGLFYGSVCAWWNRMGGMQDSIFGLLVYSSGFFPALISMRSVMFTTTAMLPAVALICFAKYVLPHLKLPRG